MNYFMHQNLCCRKRYLEYRCELFTTNARTTCFKKTVHVSENLWVCVFISNGQRIRTPQHQPFYHSSAATRSSEDVAAAQIFVFFFQRNQVWRLVVLFSYRGLIPPFFFQRLAIIDQVRRGRCLQVSNHWTSTTRTPCGFDSFSLAITFSN